MTTEAAANDGLVGPAQFDWPEEPLAAGGMAVVYEAGDRRLPRKVILKTPRTRDRNGAALSIEQRTQLEDRLRTEARILARLQHPAIVTIYEQGQDDFGAPFCVLERVSGRPLTELLDELDEAETAAGDRDARRRIDLLASMVPIAEALACAHSQGIVHRDVTPNNIIIGSRGEATLIDWGIASDAADAPGGATSAPLTRDQLDGTADDVYATIAAGTPPYVSYEQALGKPARTSYDVYTFGATLYHVVAGHPPHGGISGSAFLSAIERGDQPPPAAPWDRELSTIIADAMAHRPSDRPDANTLMARLKAYLTSEPVFLHGHRVAGRVARWIRHHRGTAVAVASAAVALIVVAIVWTALSARAQAAAERAADAANEAAVASEATAAAQRREAETERARADAERRFADARSDQTDALELAGKKEREAARARREAEQADRSSASYKKLMEEAERQEREATAARDAASAAAAEAERKRGEAHDAADSARREADQVRADASDRVRSAAAAQSDAERERDRADSARRDAERSRDEAMAARYDAEAIAADAETARRDAERTAATALQAKLDAESERDRVRAALEEALARIRQLETAGGDGSGGQVQPTP